MNSISADGFTKAPRPDPTLDDKLSFLREPRSYGASLERIDVRETNMSYVFLTESLAFKLKKPVRFPYLDFTTLAKREAACKAEVQLNRRLADGVYIEAVPLALSADGLVIGEGRRTVDWLVKMHRLDESRMLDRLIVEGRLDCRAAVALSSTLIEFYRKANAVALNPEPYLRRWKSSLQQNLAVLLQPQFQLPAGPIRHIDAVLHALLFRHNEILLDRLRGRRIVNGHGDLRPEHIWLGKQVRIIDCLEFNAELRMIDPIEELAYLDLECRHLGADIGSKVCSAVMRGLHEHVPDELYLFYRCYRAMLRARLSIAHLAVPHPRSPEKWRPQALSYLGSALADGKRLDHALKRREARTAVHRHGACEWRRPREAHKTGLRPYWTWLPAPRVGGKRCRLQ
jgi:aminoglycoside phosphotransferase family enzyme